jgi:rod shape-determining protein MreC
MLLTPDWLARPLSSFVATLTHPFTRAFSYFSYETRDFFTLVTSIGALKEENMRLHRENLTLGAENARLAQLSEENDRLRDELGLAPRERYDLLAAEVIALSTTDAGKFITVNRGENDGVARGTAVVAGKGILIGRVENTALFSSQVMLLAHPESVVPVVGATSHAVGIARGEHGLGLVLDMVLPSQALTKGEAFLTSGLGDDLPRGLLVGTIEEPRFSPDRLYQQAPLVSPISPDSVRFVYFVRQPQ